MRQRGGGIRSSAVGPAVNASGLVAVISARSCRYERSKSGSTTKEVGPTLLMRLRAMWCWVALLPVRAVTEQSVSSRSRCGAAGQVGKCARHQQVSQHHNRNSTRLSESAQVLFLVQFFCQASKEAWRRGDKGLVLMVLLLEDAHQDERSDACKQSHNLRQRLPEARVLQE